MWYVNDLLCQNEQARDIAIAHFQRSDEVIEVRPVPTTPDGSYILPINDPMEQ